MQYFTALGFDTGFTLDDARAKVDPISHGGLEHSLGRTVGRGATMPYVAKSPFFGKKLGDHLASGELAVAWCIIPLRDLKDAARSRLSASQRAEAAGKDFGDQPGGMQAGLRDARQQEKRLAVRFYDLVHVLARHGVDTLFLPFPDYAEDPGVLYSRLRVLLEAHGVTRAESDAALAEVLDLSLVHRFGAGSEGG